MFSPVFIFFYDSCYPGEVSVTSKPGNVGSSELETDEFPNYRSEFLRSSDEVPFFQFFDASFYLSYFVIVYLISFGYAVVPEAEVIYDLLRRSFLVIVEDPTCLGKYLFNDYYVFADCGCGIVIYSIVVDKDRSFDA